MRHFEEPQMDEHETSQPRQIPYDRHVAVIHAGISESAGVDISTA